ncbi:TspO/MBR family protein [Paludisphaera sp.]|uniref:TspO/MBR family protein n=1 Tax=Paludisphaera sp. TaxID=2017432 RepID=UPI00301B911B
MTSRSRPAQVVALAGFVAVVAVAGALGSWATYPSLRHWYEGLRKPSWTPPGWLFGPVWSTLYLLMAASAWRVWRRDDAPAGRRKEALACWGFQLALNVGWSWLFFGLHRPTLAFVELVALWLAILATIVATARVDRPAAWMLAPYLAWVTFAGALNGTIARLNP